MKNVVRVFALCFALMGGLTGCQKAVSEARPSSPQIPKTFTMRQVDFDLVKKPTLAEAQAGPKVLANAYKRMMARSNYVGPTITMNEVTRNFDGYNTTVSYSMCINGACFFVAAHYNEYYPEGMWFMP